MFNPTSDRGVWFVGVGSDRLCAHCLNVRPHPDGGATCAADPLKIAQAIACTQFERDPFSVVR